MPRAAALSLGWTHALLMIVISTRCVAVHARVVDVSMMDSGEPGWTATGVSRGMPKANEAVKHDSKLSENVAGSPHSFDMLANHFAGIQHLHIASLRKVGEALHLSRAARDGDKGQNSQALPNSNMPSKGLHVGARAAEVRISSALNGAREGSVKNQEKLNAKRAARVVDVAISQAKKAGRDMAVLKTPTSQEVHMTSPRVLTTGTGMANSAEEIQHLKAIDRRNGNAAYIRSLVKKLSVASTDARLHPGNKHYEKVVTALKEHLQQETKGLRKGHESTYKQKMATLDAQRHKRQKLRAERERMASIKDVLEHSKKSIRALEDAQQNVAEVSEAVRMPKAQALAKELAEATKQFKMVKQRMKTQADEKMLRIDNDGSWKQQVAELRRKSSFSPRDVVKSVQFHSTKLSMPAAEPPSRSTSIRMAQKHAKARSAGEKKAANLIIETLSQDADERANERVKDCALTQQHLVELQSKVLKTGCLRNSNEDTKMCDEFRERLTQLNKHVSDIGC